MSHFTHILPAILELVHADNQMLVGTFLHLLLANAPEAVFVTDSQICYVSASR